MEKRTYFKTEKISETVTRITGIARELMYLVVGTEKAALIDTGVGIGDLKDCVENLTDKPVIVLLTHGHTDHALGASEFQEVYMGLADLNVYKEHSQMSFRKEILKLSMGDQIEMINDEDFVLPKSIDFKPLNTGDVFHLGGITLEIYECKGHAQGSVVILLKEERTLILGDACNPNTVLFLEGSSPVEAYKGELEQLNKSIKDCYDKVYISHDSGDSSKELIHTVIAVCEDIMEGESDDIPINFLGYDTYYAKDVTPLGERADGRVGNIMYDKNRVFVSKKLTGIREIH